MNNSKTTYKRLGDYIREVDVRNSDLSVSKLVGLTIAKAFIPSVANTIGTDLSKYKIIKDNQFACSLMQVSRDGKMPIAIYKGENAIMSPAYPVFEVYKEGLLPDYLQMWFSRPEFDREAVFYAVGGVRGSLDWNDFMDMMLPVPSLDEQQRIVDRYNAIKNRIETNKQTIAKLEEAAQALYRKMFVDNIDPENLPEGWRMGTLGDTYNITYGKSLLTSRLTTKGYVVYGGNGIIGYYSQYIYDKPQVLISCRGIASGAVHLTKPYSFVTSNSLVCEQKNKIVGVNYSYYTLSKLDLTQYQSGSAQPQITINDISNVDLIIPDKEICDMFEKIIDTNIKYKNNIELENESLEDLLHNLIDIM